jgi:ribosomal protein S18 acetylase RimI-like enzyme
MYRRQQDERRNLSGGLGARGWLGAGMVVGGAAGDKRSLLQNMVSPIALIALTPEEQRAFVSEQVADCAPWLVDRGEVKDQAVALARARAEVETEIADAVQTGDMLWSAQTAPGVTVGWLWVKPARERLPAGTAFLQQILVRAAARRRGHGRAMLAALEQRLADTGWRELRLNIWGTNQPGRRLYECAGYALVKRLAGKRQLGKRLVSVVVSG